MRWGIAGLGAAVLLGLAVRSPVADAAAPACEPGGPPVVMAGSVASSDAKTYRDLPFEVAPGTTRIEVGYSWEDVLPLPDTPGPDLIQTVLDLGLWDEGGVGTVDGFRGWSGSRQGKTAEGQDPIWVQADTAERGYLPGPVEPGTWNVDLGVGSVSPSGATYEVTVTCLATAVGPAFVSRPVDATHIANPDPGWYHADFHMHGRHSNSNAPDWDGFVQFARDAGLDILPVTDYVTTQHWRELGPVQAANPDLLIWPSREVITYFGHSTVFGETPHVVEWRHGAPGVSLADIQAGAVADGALFGVAHPTIFPPPVFASFCRGCYFELDDVIDWDGVTMMEILTGPNRVDATELGLPDVGVQIQNPFVITAIEKWEQLLMQGHKITAVSGSDDKLGPGLGSSATAVYAQQLSRSGVKDALRAGHAYVRAEGVAASPVVDVHAAVGEEQGIVGDTLHADAAQVTVHVQRANGQLLSITRDGLPAAVVPITSDDFTHTYTATRSTSSGPLGTFWRVDTLALTSGSSSPYFTTIGNPVFLAGPTGSSSDGGDGGFADSDYGPADSGRLPATGAGAPELLALVALVAALAGRRVLAR